MRPALLALVAVILLAAPAHAATVANPGSVTLTGGPSEPVGSQSFEGFAATGIADSAGTLAFPAADVAFL